MYTGAFKYKNENTMYELSWALNDQDHPLMMAGDFENEDQFFNYVCKEIDAKRFFLRKHFILKMETNPATHNDANIPK